VQIENPLTEWAAAFPVLESVHLLGIVCALGMVAVVNLRLLGVGPPSSPSRLWRQTMPFTLGGLTIAITSGFLLFTIASGEYSGNRIFWWKMVALVVALVFYFTAVRSAASRDRSSSVVAVISLLFFALVPLGGILLGYE
jgi:hypothetical protein